MEVSPIEADAAGIDAHGTIAERSKVPDTAKATDIMPPGMGEMVPVGEAASGETASDEKLPNAVMDTQSFVQPAVDGPSKSKMINYVLKNVGRTNSTFLDRLMRLTLHYNRFRLERVNDRHRRVVCCPHDGDPETKDVWYDDEKVVHAYFRRTILKDLKQMLHDAHISQVNDNDMDSNGDESGGDSSPAIQRYELIGEGDTLDQLVRRTLVSSLQLEPSSPDIELDSKKNLFSFADKVVEHCMDKGGESILNVRPRTMDDNIRMVSSVNIGNYTGLNDIVLSDSDKADMQTIETLLAQCIVNEHVRDFRLAMVANMHFRYDKYEQLKLVLYTVSGPDCGKTMVDLIENAVYAPYSEFVTQKGQGGGLNERATMNSKARMHKIMEARQTNALYTLIKDVYANMAPSKTRAFTDDKLSGGMAGTDGVTKLAMTGNVEEMLPCPGAHVMDKVLLIMEFDKEGNRILGKFVKDTVVPDKAGYFTKDLSKGEVMQDARMRTAAARVLLRVGQTTVFDPKKEPDAIVGLKDYWARVQGLDSNFFSTAVEAVGYDSLPAPADRGINMTPRSSIIELPPVLSHPFKTDDEAIEHYVRLVSSAIDFNAPTGLVKLIDIASSIKGVCTPFEWKAMGGVSDMKGFDRSDLATRLREMFDKISSIPMFRGAGGTHRYKGRQERVSGWHVYNARLPEVSLTASPSTGVAGGTLNCSSKRGRDDSDDDDSDGSDVAPNQRRRPN